MQTQQEIARRFLEQGYRQQLSGAVESAINLYRAALEMHPTAEAYRQLASAYSQQGRYEDAVDQCMLAIELNPDYGEAYNDLGVYLMAMDCYEAAISWLEKAIAAPNYPNRATAYMNLARAYQHFGQTFKVAQTLREAWQREKYIPALNAYQTLLGSLN
ncbi:MAG: tetratricopeptide repeat protein [Anaerolineae bacterium]|nr:tetratricopeptide repeat protein [Anaerolineae bacterium]MDW8300406.1 tetratricopeptide repeat protein [Anaerolineae bacterium]